MKIFDFLGYNLNGLELVVYIIIPSSIILMILVYVYFNIELIKMSLAFDVDLSEKFKKGYKDRILKDYDKEKEKTLNKISEIYKDSL